MTFVRVGDRIRLDSMTDDPDPIPIGTMGTVDHVSEVTLFNPPYTQVGVKWDNGRTLGLCVPPDRFTVVEKAVVN